MFYHFFQVLLQVTCQEKLCCVHMTIIFFSSKLQIQVDDHVSTKGGLTGYIRYIGHMDKVDQSQSHLLFVGLELDTAGNLDLCLSGLI